MNQIARALLAVIALFAGIMPWFADYNETHIFNPNWPPHAVLHDGQVLVFTSAASVLAIFFLLRRRGDAWSNFLAAFWFVALYWLSLSAAPFFPRAAWLDPELVSDPAQYILGIPGNAFVCMIIDPLLAIIGIMGWRGHRQAGAQTHVSGGEARDRRAKSVGRPTPKRHPRS